MSTALRYIAAILLSGTATTLCWAASSWERRLADADERLVTFKSTDSSADYTPLERSMELAAHLPWFGHLLAEVREHHAAADYRHSVPVAPDDNPTILFISANSAYRASLRGGDRTATIARLNDVLQRYARVLDKKPEIVDAAYDYEYVTWLRNLLVKTKDANPSDEGMAPIHGKPGSLQEENNMNRFKALVPKQPEERHEGTKDAGLGMQKTRKG
jgi:hypothetical protein